MSSHALHLLLPFSLLPEWQEDEMGWAHACAQPSVHRSAIEAHSKSTPALRRILRRATHGPLVSIPAEARSCAHEHWLAACSHFTALKEAPLAPYAALADGKEPGTALWACIRPVHFQLARTHLVLHGSEGLDLTVEEASALFEAAQNVAALYQLTLIAPTPASAPLQWYIYGEALGRIVGSSPSRVEGQNIELWLPYLTNDTHNTKDYAQVWMQFQNEVQMVWATHEVNRRREAHRKLPANALWLWGQGALLKKPQTLEDPLFPTPPFSAVFSNQSTTRGLGLAAGLPVALTPPIFDQLPAPSPTCSTDVNAAVDSQSDTAILVELDSLIHAAIQHHAQAWHTALMELERNWFAPALCALQKGTLARLILTLTGENHSLTLSLTRTDLYKFWRRHTLAF